MRTLLDGRRTDSNGNWLHMLQAFKATFNAFDHVAYKSKDFMPVPE
jgi:hypothetical protein